MDNDMLRSIRAERRELGVRPTASLFRAARAGLNLSMLDLARLANVSVSVVCRVEKRACDVDDALTQTVWRGLESAGVRLLQTDAGLALHFDRDTAC